MIGLSVPDLEAVFGLLLVSCVPCDVTDHPRVGIHWLRVVAWANFANGAVRVP